jgi:hypothetical protein
MSLLTFGEAILTGKPFRHFTMRPSSKWHPEIWFSIIDNDNVHVLGPDDIMPMDEAIPLEWRLGACFEVREAANE